MNTTCEWKEYELGKLLTYEQPTSYIVESTEYNDKYKTPVLTAGKSFILGYTNETQGIYKAPPVIIFDDFTTASQYVNFEFKVKSSAMKILTPNTELVLPKFIYYRMQIIQFDHSTHKRYWIQQYSKIKVSVPPIPVQEQIVAKIEELFSELDKGVETLQKTKQQLAVYRQAVLKQAFSADDNAVKVASICTVVRGGSPRPAGDEKYYNGTIPFLKVADLTNNADMYLYSHTYTIKEAGLTKTRLVPANTLLLSNSGATLGVPKICTFETTFNDGIAAFLGLDYNKEYLPYHYYFWLSKLPEMRAIDQGAAQPNLNTTIIGDVDIPHHDIQTQKQIAEWIESRLSVCDNIEKTVDITLQQAEAMRQSILKQAFEGSNKRGL